MEKLRDIIKVSLYLVTVVVLYVMIRIVDVVSKKKELKTAY